MFVAASGMFYTYRHVFILPMGTTVCLQENSLKGSFGKYWPIIFCYMLVKYTVLYTLNNECIKAVQHFFRRPILMFWKSCLIRNLFFSLHWSWITVVTALDSRVSQRSTGASDKEACCCNTCRTLFWPVLLR